jgi:hypothetical protein
MDMRRTRVGFRAFRLIITLTSLVTASLAIRARTDSFELAREHTLLAKRIRIRLDSNDARTEDGRQTWERKAPPLVSQKWAAGCDLQILPPVRSEEELPAKGRDLIVIGEMYGVLRIRIFDGAGRIVVDIAEGGNGNGAHDQSVAALNRRVADLGPPHDMSGAEKAEVITAATSVVNSCRAVLIAYGRSVDAEAKAQQAKDVAEAEHHERIARSYRP